MKETIIISTITVAILALCAWLILPYEHRYIEPTANWRWKACGTTYHIDGMITGCSLGLSLDQATWWTETKDGSTQPHGTMPPP